jgi:hypothetical protein
MAMGNGCDIHDYMNSRPIGTRQEVIAAYMPTEKRSKEANIVIFREIPEKTGGKIRLKRRMGRWAWCSGPLGIASLLKGT